MKIFLIRHGESEANANGIHQGQRYDVGLSERGKEQARRIAERLKNEKIEAIYSSDLTRAKQTAEEIAKPHKLKVIHDKRLREFDSGDWGDKFNKENYEKNAENPFVTWMKYREIEAKKIGIAPEDVKMPGGESDNDMVSRVGAFLKDAMKHKSSIVIVAHGGPNKVIIGITTNAKREDMFQQAQHNTCVNEIEYNPKTKKWHAHIINCTKHLE